MQALACKFAKHCIEHARYERKKARHTTPGFLRLEDRLLLLVGRLVAAGLRVALILLRGRLRVRGLNLGGAGRNRLRIFSAHRINPSSKT
jgi:hypothetical protein